MRQFPVPMDLLEEEKLIGGVLSLRQILWVCAPLPAVGMAWAALAAVGAPAWVHAAAYVPLAGGGIFFAFGRVAGLSADRYVWMAVRFRARVRRWALRREGTAGPRCAEGGGAS